MSTPQKRREPLALPSVGSVFLVPLPDGRFTACRVIRHDENSFGTPLALVVGTRWMGTTAPSLNEPLLRELLILNHHSWRNRIEAFFALDDVPPDFTLLGTLPPTSDDLRIESQVLTNWASVRIQSLTQWRWDNDRDALFADEENVRQQEEALALASAKRRKSFLASVTLDRLREKRRFDIWEGGLSGELIDVCRRIFLDTINSLAAPTGNPSKKLMFAVIRECVKRLNQLDEEYGFIDTGRREDLCEEIDEIVSACGFADDQGIADRWREW